MVVSNEGSKPTHEDWQNAMNERDSFARKIVRALIDGKPTTAKQYAIEWDKLDDKMFEISRILDGDGTD